MKYPRLLVPCRLIVQRRKKADHDGLDEDRHGSRRGALGRVWKRWVVSGATDKRSVQQPGADSDLESHKRLKTFLVNIALFRRFPLPSLSHFASCVQFHRQETFLCFLLEAHQLPIFIAKVVSLCFHVFCTLWLPMFS